MATTTSTFKLYKSLIFETVKNETHIAAHVARAMDKNAAELAFQEEAGDESYHERKLERSLYSSLDKIKAEIIDYLNTESDGSNNMTCTVGTDEIVFTITLSSRFNTAYLTPLADLISKYVEDSILFEWWTPINANNAKMYSEKAELARQSVLKCFIKNAPLASTYSYNDVTGGADGESTTKSITVESSKTINNGETVMVKYTLGGGLTSSDITVTSSDEDVVTVGAKTNTSVAINAISAGTARVAVICTNDASVSGVCRVTVE